MSCPAKNNNNKEYKYLNNKGYSSIQHKRKTFKNKSLVRFKITILLCLLLGFVLPKAMFSMYDYMFLNPLKNANITVPDDISLLRSSEKFLANDYFLGNNTIGDVNFSNSLLKTPGLTGQMYKLTTRLKQLAARTPQIEPGIFIFDYSTGKYVDIKADQDFPTASMIKIPILLELFRKIDSGQVNLNDRMTLTDYYVTAGSGFLQYRPIGSQFLISMLAQKMIQESDNTATNMLLSTVGGVNNFNRIIKSWGFSRTFMSNWLPDLDGTNVATPHDFGTLLYNIDNPAFLSLQSRVNIFNIMSNVRNRFLIQAGLPDNVQFIHKTGDIGTMLGDAGIVMLPNGKKYIIVIMVNRPWNSYVAKQFIIDASKVTYNSYVSNDL